MLAGTVYRGMFEERIKKAEEADGKVVLFIEEMHACSSGPSWQQGRCQHAGASLGPRLVATSAALVAGATTFTNIISVHGEMDRRVRAAVTECI
ncbi:ATP-dependent Clp protease ATP-binding subunit ClpC [Panicum miliaceum]|uniref:ATP-dependent Clp protease ATP-binding subunit ClpC n=1 Tax=Panicum miliaceum TaxID=4540 RepID=A0A3L6RW31_PANMI|nr:ATP-dependent Clp protease ATP-binding subunit ClpC [Panicum miliaceum]